MVFPLFEALRFIILAVSRSEKQIFLAAIFAGWPAVGRPTAGRPKPKFDEIRFSGT